MCFITLFFVFFFPPFSFPFFKVLLQILPCFTIWTKIPPRGGIFKIYIPELLSRKYSRRNGTTMLYIYICIPIYSLMWCKSVELIQIFNLFIDCKYLHKLKHSKSISKHCRSLPGTLWRRQPWGWDGTRREAACSQTWRNTAPREQYQYLISLD